MYQKDDLIDLTLSIAIMNCFAEGFAKTLRKNKHAPTSETLLDYLKTANVDSVLQTAKVQIDKCVKALRKKGIRLNKAAIAFDWHDQPYYGSHQTQGVIGTKPKDGTSYAYSYLTVSVITPKKTPRHSSPTPKNQRQPSAGHSSAPRLRDAVREKPCLRSFRQRFSGQRASARAH